jgi:pimeloyl-ACP methyl ester carboxylesterase
MSSLDDWITCGYLPALRPHYQVVMIDSRGHGESDKPHDEAAYTLDRGVSDVTSVLDALNIDQAHFWGYSMGGYIGYGMADYAPSRVRKLIVGAAHPYARDQEGHRRLLREGITGGPDAFVAAFERVMGPIAEDYAQKLLRVADVQAWLAGAGDRIGVEHVLGSMKMPCCIYCGDNDPLFPQTKLASEHVSGAYFFALPGLSHVQDFAHSYRVLPNVQAFLSDR